MSIPFIVPAKPGENAIKTVDRPVTVENLASDFLDARGRYLLEILTEGDDAGCVHLMAIIDTKAGKAEKVAEETCHNSPALPRAIDRLVQASHKHLPPYVPEVRTRTRLILPPGVVIPANQP